MRISKEAVVQHIAGGWSEECTKYSAPYGDGPTLTGLMRCRIQLGAEHKASDAGLCPQRLPSRPASMDCAEVLWLVCPQRQQRQDALQHGLPAHQCVPVLADW